MVVSSCVVSSCLQHFPPYACIVCFFLVVRCWFSLCPHSLRFPHSLSLQQKPLDSVERKAVESVCSVNIISFILRNGGDRLAASNPFVALLSLYQSNRQHSSIRCAVVHLSLSVELNPSLVWVERRPYRLSSETPKPIRFKEQVNLAQTSAVDACLVNMP